MIQTRDPMAQPETSEVSPIRDPNKVKGSQEHYSQLTALTSDPDFKALPVQSRLAILKDYMTQKGGAKQFGEDQARLDKTSVDEHGEVYRGAAGVGRAVAGIPTGVYHAVVDEPRPEEGILGDLPHGRLTLALKRLLYDPNAALEKRSAQREKAGDKTGAFSDRILGDIPLVGPFVNSLAERAGAGDVAGAITEGGTAAALPKVPKLAKSAGIAALEHYTTSMRPITLDIEGVKVPMLQSEAAPESSVGMAVRDMKRAGIGEKHFARFADAQQKAVKEVIRKVATKTSGAVSAMPESAGGSLATAANAVESTAKPMYQALDASLTSVPSTLDATAKVVQKAIRDAEKIGISVGDLDAGMAPTKPFATYQTLRSRLLQHARSSSDPAVRAEIFRHVDTIDDAIERGFSGKPDLLNNWKEANRLWRKMYALKEVGQAIDAATKGSPDAVQSSLASKGATASQAEIQGTSLVKRLNDLADRSHGPSFLERAFDETPEGRAHAMAVRQVAEILNRAEAAGSSNLAAAGTKYSLMWKLLKKVGGSKIAEIMTTPKGAQAFVDALQKQTPVAQAKAVVKHAPALVVEEETRAKVSQFAKQAQEGPGNVQGEVAGSPEGSGAPEGSEVAKTRYTTWRDANFTRGANGWEDEAGNVYTDEYLHQIHDKGANEWFGGSAKSGKPSPAGSMSSADRFQEQHDWFKKHYNREPSTDEMQRMTDSAIKYDKEKFDPRQRPRDVTKRSKAERISEIRKLMNDPETSAEDKEALQKRLDELEGGSN